MPPEATQSKNLIHPTIQQLSGLRSTNKCTNIFLKYVLQNKPCHKTALLSQFSVYKGSVKGFVCHATHFLAVWGIIHLYSYNSYSARVGWIWPYIIVSGPIGLDMIIYCRIRPEWAGYDRILSYPARVCWIWPYIVVSGPSGLDMTVYCRIRPEWYGFYNLWSGLRLFFQKDTWTWNKSYSEVSALI